MREAGYAETKTWGSPWGKVAHFSVKGPTEALAHDRAQRAK